ncbi:exported protein of unknown function [Candidatus Filomicrobium marinum]|uniref:Cytochrome c n=3 Tax=Hyphomicrobiaceae TaxID=45401 RepID=A0A0D6JHF3_9HYPH|nr:exported protein of unknown function [Candidatus Filomicrobium marinum]CPR20215.1 exported protein of unknown function [Candidatus Filomicrobium marinum]SDP12099.1 hypothetical protein SAMN04488061_2243 [Filomicrobium insigne]
MRLKNIMSIIALAPRWLSALVIGICVVFAGVPTVGAQQQEEDEYQGLPEGEGREEVAAYCGACHSLGLVSQQKLPRHRWEDLLVWMNEKQGMPKLPPEDEKIVLDYLTEHLGPPKTRRRF